MFSPDFTHRHGRRKSIKTTKRAGEGRKRKKTNDRIRLNDMDTCAATYNKEKDQDTRCSHCGAVARQLTGRKSAIRQIDERCLFT